MVVSATTIFVYILFCACLYPPFMWFQDKEIGKRDLWTYLAGIGLGIIVCCLLNNKPNADEIKEYLRGKWRVEYLYKEVNGNMIPVDTLIIRSDGR